ncbi:MAG: hypothetical protein WCD18_16460 [Thermosynechococcaceae cyanobacterium]
MLGTIQFTLVLVFGADGYLGVGLAAIALPPSESSTGIEGAANAETVFVEDMGIN